MRQAAPRLWPFTRLPCLGDPFGTSLAPQAAEPLAPIPPTLHQTLPRDAPETPHRPSDPRSEGRWGVSGGATEVGAGGWGTPFLPFHRKQLGTTLSGITASQYRSEERRVGKECRSRWPPHHVKK